jgi:2-polyprenyl-3-methyl-5-hydroxy-6-metoxy-1,4-benzoquinol methylase
MLFDESFYLRINQARWEMAERVISQIRAGAAMELSTCLDVGCGPGWFSERLAGLELRVEGVEGRLENVEAARRRVPAVRFHHLDIEAEHGIGALAAYDLVFCFGLLYHTENPFRVIRNLRRLTRKVLFVETQLIPDEAPSARLVSENVNETQGLTHHAWILSRAALAKMLQVSGFANVYEYVTPLDHEDFRETPTRHRVRRVFLASELPIRSEELAPFPLVPAPKLTFDKGARE